MTVIQLDGGGEIQTGPGVDTIGVLYPGERMDVIIALDTTLDASSSLVIILDQE